MDGAEVQLMTQDCKWQHGVIKREQHNMKVNENEQQILLRNIVEIVCDDQAINDRGDSGTLVFSTEGRIMGANAVIGLLVYGMAVGKVDLTDGTSFTVANRLYDILPAIRSDPDNLELFHGYKELNLCGGTAEQPDTGYNSVLPYADCAIKV